MVKLMITVCCLVLILAHSSSSDEVTPFQFLVTPPSTYTGGVFTTDCNLGDVRGLQRCPATLRLTDNVTDEGTSGFVSNNFMGWNQSFTLEIDFGQNDNDNVYITQVDIYFYNRPTEGYGLPDVSTSISFGASSTPLLSTYTDNSQLYRTDNEVQVISLVVLSPLSSLFIYRTLRLNFNFSSYSINQTFLSELRFFTDTSTAVDNGPIEFLSPNQSVQLGPILQSSVQLTCTVANNGSFVWLSWTGPAVDNDKTQVQLADTSRTSILTISGLSANDSGIYTCTVAYSRSEAGGVPPTPGRVQSRQTLTNVELFLNGSVTATISPVIVGVDTNVSLQCNFTGYLPADYEVIWRDNSGDTITEMEGIDITTEPTGPGQSQRGGNTPENGISSTLTITLAEAADSGNYICEMADTDIRGTVSLLVTVFPSSSSTTASSVASSTIPTPSNQPVSGISGALIGGVAAGAVIFLLIAILIPVIICIVVVSRKRKSLSLLANSDSNNGLYAELSKPAPPPLPPDRVFSSGYASIDVTSNGFRMADMSSQSPAPFSSHRNGTPDQPTPARITSKPEFLHDNPMYASSEKLDHPVPREYLKPTRSLPHIADSDEQADMGSQFNIYARPSKPFIEPPPVPPYRGTPEPDDGGVYTFEGFHPEAFRRQSFDTNSELYATYRAIYSDPQPLQRSEDLLLEIKEKNIRELKELGMGQFGVVVLAHTVALSLKQLGMSESNNDPGVSLVVAIKRLRSEADDKMREMFEKEVKFMARLRHENVVRLLGVCLSHNAFIMMEYMENGDLNHYLRKQELIDEINPLPENTVTVPVLIYMCMQVSKGMRYLASLRFIHRDLATRNILVGQDFKVKIADFGMSQNLYSDFYYRIQGRAVLPIRWMANECFYGRFSEKTDVWSYGVLMWEIFTLCRQQPYEHMSDQEVIDDAIKGSERLLPSQPTHCPNEIYEVMLKCWVHIPEERASFEDIYDMLSNIHAYSDFS